MARSPRNLEALGGASTHATQALDALESPQYADVPMQHKEAWAMAAVIHCDLCRVVVALDECEPGAAKLLSMAEIVSKLYEARKWYSSAGAKSLREIARQKCCGEDYVNRRLKELKTLHPINEVERYGIYRNRVGHHYDAETPKYIAMFGAEDADAFYAILMTFAHFSGEWAKLVTNVIQDGPAAPSIKPQRLTPPSSGRLRRR